MTTALTTRPAQYRNQFAAILAEHSRNGEYPLPYNPAELHADRHVELRDLLRRAAYRKTRDHEVSEELASHLYFHWLTRDYAAIPQGPRYVFRGDHPHSVRAILRLANRMKWTIRQGGIQGRPQEWAVDHDGNMIDDGADRRTAGRYRKRFRLNDRELMERRAASMDPAKVAEILENSVGYWKANGLERLGITGETAEDILRLTTWGTPAVRAHYAAQLSPEDRERARAERYAALRVHRRRRQRESQRRTESVSARRDVGSRSARRKSAARAAAARRRSARGE